MKRQKFKYGTWVVVLTFLAVIIHALKWITIWDWLELFGIYLVWGCIIIAVALMILDRRNMDKTQNKK